MQLKCYHFFNQDLQTQGWLTCSDVGRQSEAWHASCFPVPVIKIRPGVVVQHVMQRPGKPNQFMPLHVTAIAPVVQPVDGMRPSHRLSAAAGRCRDAHPRIRRRQVPVVFTMKEMGIDFPVVLSDQPINKIFKVPNPNYEPPEFGYPGAAARGHGR